MVKKESDFDKLARLIKDESEDIRTELGGKIDALGKKVDFGFARVDHELASIRAELKSIRADIAVLHVSVGQHEGYEKEIDHILRRIAAIEKRVGIKHPAHRN